MKDSIDNSIGTTMQDRINRFNDLPEGLKQILWAAIKIVGTWEDLQVPYLYKDQTLVDLILEKPITSNPIPTDEMSENHALLNRFKNHMKSVKLIRQIREKSIELNDVIDRMLEINQMADKASQAILEAAETEANQIISLLNERGMEKLVETVLENLDLEEDAL